MKKIIAFFLLISLIYSCSVEKRHYRNGWYIDHVNRAENWLDAQRHYPVARIDSSAAEEKKSDSVSSTVSAGSKIDFIAADKKTNSADSAVNTESVQQKSQREPLPRMTYTEARNRMREQGCTPDPFANTLYILSVAAYPLTIITGIGFFLAIAILILSPFAKKRVIDSGICVEENLALIRLSQKNSIILLILIVALTFLLLALITGFFGLWF